MRSPFGKSEKGTSPPSSLDQQKTDTQQYQNYPGANDASYPVTAAAYDQNDDDPEAVVCPPTTTERKLITKIDFRIIPVLCILYLLAFLGKSTSSPPSQNKEREAYLM
jgi:hypothetical protein